jgi:CubicO group peptidase (beta-lactamase class C family)
MKWNFEKLIKRVMKISHLSALSAGIVSDNKLVWKKGYGLYDRKNNKKADETTIYLMSSLTKSITATAVMQLFERNYFNLDDDVNNYLPFILRNPNFPNIPITIRMLLSHSSSLGSEEGDLYAKTQMPSGEKDIIHNYYTRIIPANLKIDNYPNPFLKEYLIPGGIYNRALVWNNIKPGKVMVYSNIAYGVLGYIVELLTKQSFEKYCQKNIFKPLDMIDTSFFLSNLDIKRIALSYEYKSGKYIPIIPYTFLAYPSGSLRTTIKDLANFIIANMNDGMFNDFSLLKKENIKEMHTVQCQKTYHNFKYGLGWQIKGKSTSNKILFNTGGFWGVRAKMIISKYDKIGILFFANVNPFDSRKTGKILRRYLTDTMIEQLLFRKAFHNY